HAWSAWLMKAPAVLVQLTMLLVLGFGAAGFVPSTQHGQLLAALFGVGAVALAALATFGWLHAASLPGRSVKLFLFLAAAVASLATAMVALLADRWTHMIYFGA